MHTWGDEDFDWAGLDKAIRYIDKNLKRWGRIQVHQAKEKFGTARVYCHLGFSGLWWLWKPGHVYYRGPKWMPKWMNWPPYWITSAVNLVFVPYQARVYRTVYKKAVRQWPHLVCEITHDADFNELLDGLCPHPNCGWKRVT